jgi:hypothetical protein
MPAAGTVHDPLEIFTVVVPRVMVAVAGPQKCQASNPLSVYFACPLAAPAGQTLEPPLGAAAVMPGNAALPATPWLAATDERAEAPLDAGCALPPPELQAVTARASRTTEIGRSMADRMGIIARLGVAGRHSSASGLDQDQDHPLPYP